MIRKRSLLKLLLSSLLVLVLAGCESSGPSKGPVTGVIGAMNEEVETLIGDLSHDKVKTIAGMEFHQGKFDGKETVVVKSGVGKVNAAACAQILIDVFHVDQIINTGVAGSVDPSLSIGDIVISTEAVQHDVDVTPFGYEPGVIPDLSDSVFHASTDLVKSATAAVSAVAPEVKFLEGRVVSGDQFISADADKKRLAETFGGLCAEMEGAAVAHTAWLNQVPFVIIRAISDKADHSASMEFAEFEQLAIRRLVRLIREMLPAMKR